MSASTLYLVSGASGSGKSAIVPLLTERTGFAWHDFDSIGVPAPVPAGWRHRTLRWWVERLTDAGPSVGLCAPVAHGELLATPGVDRLAATHACLLDCADEVRIRRLLRRRKGVDLETLQWAGWLRRHAVDPRHDPFVLTDGSTEEMRWEAWTERPADDGWEIAVIDTTELEVDAVADHVAAWVRRCEFG